MIVVIADELKSYYHRFSWKEISDPIYGYVYFNREVEEPIINHILVQRLRYIMQLQTAHLVYPGAVHTRFQHSLGVMHLAGLMAEDMLSKIINYYGEEYLEGYSKASLLQAVRLAGLLHDAGHACFGHAFEEIILFSKKDLPDELANHERIGYTLVKTLLEDLIREFERTYGLDHLYEILLKIIGSEKPREKMIMLMRWIIKESLYQADILDFLRRDSYYTGTHEYGYIDYERLYKNTYPYFENNRVMLLLDRSAWGEFRAYLYAKASMYEHVYLHSVNRAFDRLLKEILERLDQELVFAERVKDILRGKPESYLMLTDVYMYSIMLDKALRGEGEVGRLSRKLLIDRKPEWKRVGREYILSSYKGPVVVRYILQLIFNKSYRERVRKILMDRLVDRLKGRGVEPEDIWVDIVNISPVPESMLIPGKAGEGLMMLTLFMGKRKGMRIVKDQEIMLIKEGLPLMSIFRTYIRRGLHKLEYESIVTETVNNTIEEELKIHGGEEDYTKIVNEIFAEVSSEEFKKRVTK